MAEKTLGEIAHEKWREELELTERTSPDMWESVAFAVVAAHEARRWRPWPPPTEEQEPSIVALDYPEHRRRLAFRSEGFYSGEPEWHDESGENITEKNAPKRWSPIPAPPQEANHGN